MTCQLSGFSELTAGCFEAFLAALRRARLYIFRRENEGNGESGRWEEEKSGEKRNTNGSNLPRRHFPAVPSEPRPFTEKVKRERRLTTNGWINW